MSHSKHNKRGRSLYVENWNPAAKKYILTCALCGKQGYSPTILDAGFFGDLTHEGDFARRAIYNELTKTLECLPLDELGRCEHCAKRMDP